MHVSELFLTFVRRLIFSFLLILLVAGVSHAQNGGTIGIYTAQIAVFSNQAAGVSSGGTWQCFNPQTGLTPNPCAVFPDHGFAANSLFVCTTGFSGTIDLEWSPTGNAPFYPLIIANYSNDTTCAGGNPPGHVLQLGGYFPNVRSTVTRSAGSVSAWYTASASPISFFPAAMNSNGATSPVQCDKTVTGTGAAGYTAIVTDAGFATRGVNVCGFTISFEGATSANTLGIQLGGGLTCSGGVYPWTIATTASTPQVLSVGGGLGTIFQFPFAVTNICLNNNSGATVNVAVNYALQ